MEKAVTVVRIMADLPEACVVRIFPTDGDPVGAGFLVGPRLMVTCAHVVCDALGLPRHLDRHPSAEVKLDFPFVAPWEFFFARVVVWKAIRPDSEGDIAGLELTRDAPRGCQTGPYEAEVRGHRFKAYGFPTGHPNGVWAYGFFGPRLSVNWIQIEDDKTPGQRVRAGFSGGAVWSEDRRCITGMVVAADADPTAKTAFVVPIETIFTAWPTLRDSASPPAQPARRRPSTSASANPEAAPAGSQGGPGLTLSPEELILAAADGIERRVVEECINMISGDNRSETMRMQKLFRRVLSEGFTSMGDIRETAPLLGRAISQFHRHFMIRIESIKDRVNLLNRSIERSLSILHRPPFSSNPSGGGMTAADDDA